MAVETVETAQTTAGMKMMTMTTTIDPVTVSLADLRAGTVPHATLELAFGPTSLGILLVRDLPPQLPSLRSTVLSNASRLAALPAETLEGLTDERAKYLVGWSHGKETLKAGGGVDRGKGSYYVNCGEFYSSKTPGEEGKLGNENENDDCDDCDDEQEEGRQTGGYERSAYTSPNRWPDEADIPGFRASAQDLISLIIDVAVLVARACDRYAEEEEQAASVPGYRRGLLEGVVRTSRTTKARLLHYFPPPPPPEREGEGETEIEGDGDGDGDGDDWCATHVDHGCLTGLTSAMFVDESSPSPPSSPTHPTSKSTTTTTPTTTGSGSGTHEREEMTNPPPAAGLYICSRDGDTVKIDIPRDCLAFQTGQALELMTRGRFKAVPHFVRGVPRAGRGDGGGRDGGGGGGGGDRGRIARNTLAVFTQPNLGDLVDVERGVTFGEFADEVVSRNTA